MESVSTFSLDKDKTNKLKAHSNSALVRSAGGDHLEIMEGNLPEVREGEPPDVRLGLAH